MSRIHHRIAWIDQLKGLAILGVLTVHVAQRCTGLPPWLWRIADSGQFGVEAFFVVSAYAALHSMRRHLDEGESVPWTRFYVRRAFRIVPLAYLALAANVALYRPNVTPKGLALTLLFLNGWSPVWINALIRGGWFIADLAMFYLFTPVLMRWVRGLGPAIALAVLSVPSAYLFREAAVVVLGRSPEEFLHFWPPSQFPAFALGIVLYYVLEEGPPGWAGSWWALWVPAGAALALSQAPRFWGVHYLYAILAVAIAIALSERKAGLLNNDATALFGRMSYSLYLWHPFALALVLMLVRRTVVVGPIDFGALLVATLMASTAVAYVSHGLFERGLVHWGDRISGRVLHSVVPHA